MNVSKNTTIFAGAQPGTIAAREAAATEEAAKRGKVEKGSVFAGSLNEDLFANSILEKKKEAQRKAMQVVGDAWESDQKIEKDLDERRELINKLEKENQAALKEIDEYTRMQEEMKEEYGITDDSKEQQDLELIRKYNRMLKDEMNGKISSENRLTREEIEYVQRLKAEGLTDYQQKQLDLDSAKSVYQQTVSENKKTIVEENAIIRGVRLEKLKSDPMLKAQDEAQAIREAASKEITGMVVEQAKEHIDQLQEEAEEKAEKLEEKQEKLEEFIESQKEKREESEEIMEDMPVREMAELEQIKSDVKQEVENIVNKMALVVEDIKGAMVDEKL
ncbi:MAG: hypothetical protein IJP31_05070 [Lachnospiraceae bacterium]|nr:hypothetical protein [Lachnospiraceae bacterium]